MFLKYFIINAHDYLIALKFNPNTEKAIIGGHLEIMDIIEGLLKDYFNQIGSSKKRYSGYYKVRYEFYIKPDKFFECKLKLEKNGIILRKTKKHGRIMR